MPEKKVYVRVRGGLVYAELGPVYRGMLDQMVEADHSDTTKFLRFLVKKEWEARGNPELLEVLGEKIPGANPVPVFGVKAKTVVHTQAKEKR